jgi:hypothetical protein
MKTTVIAMEMKTIMIAIIMKSDGNANENHRDGRVREGRWSR